MSLKKGRIDIVEVKDTSVIVKIHQNSRMLDFFDSAIKVVEGFLLMEVFVYFSSFTWCPTIIEMQ